MHSGITYSEDPEKKQDQNAAQQGGVQIGLSYQQYLYIQHHLPKGFALAQKKLFKREKKESTSRIVDDTISRLSGGLETGEEKQSKKRERKKRAIYADDEPLKIIKRKSFEKIVVDQQMQQCYQILIQLKKSPYSYPFLEPVDPKTSGASDYLQVITDPMDLSTIQKTLRNGGYHSANQFHGDIQKIWYNSYRYNDKFSDLYKITQEMQKLYKKLSADVNKKAQKAEQQNMHKVWSESKPQRQRNQKDNQQKNVISLMQPEDDKNFDVYEGVENSYE